MKDRLRAAGKSAGILLRGAWIAADIELRDVFAFGGLAAIGYGLALVYPPAAWIVCGAVVFWMGVR